VRKRRPASLLVSVLAVLAAVLLVACEKPDASHVTSPSARALIGTTTGNVAYRPPESPPAEVPSPEGWEVTLENARFSELENGNDSIHVAMQVKAEQGTAFEVWLTDAEGTAFRWSGGSSRGYNGVVCFHVRLEDDTDALDLREGPYDMTVAFRDPGTEEAVFAQTLRVAGRPGRLEGTAPGEGSAVARDLLGCPRSVI
jgi:hypothetical protein